MERWTVGEEQAIVMHEPWQPGEGAVSLGTRILSGSATSYTGQTVCTYLDLFIRDLKEGLTSRDAVF